MVKILENQNFAKVKESIENVFKLIEFLIERETLVEDYREHLQIVQENKKRLSIDWDFPLKEMQILYDSVINSDRSITPQDPLFRAFYDSMYFFTTCHVS